MPRTVLALASVCAALALAACGSDDDDSDATTAATTTEESGDEAAAAADEDAGAQGGGQGGGGQGGGGAKPGVTITTADSQFGEVVFDGDRRAIYVFDKETGSQSECYDACATAWPPVLTEGDPAAEGGAEAKLLGTTERDDGKTQVTYDGQPLYYYVDDPPGEILCHNVDEFGGLWLALEPSGRAVG